MVTIAICDDEQKFRKNMSAFCQQYMEEKDMLYEIKEYESGEAFLMEESPDILLLDITMKRISGLIVRDILVRSHAKTRILFVSENKRFMSEAFGKNVYGFLQKPLHYERFCEKMEEILYDIEDSQQYMYCRKGQDIEAVYFKSILYVEAHGRYTRIYVQGEKEYRTSDKGIRMMKKILAPFHFVQCNRMQVVNFRYVTNLQEEVELINGVCLSLTESYRSGIYKEYKRWGGRI